MIDKEATYHNDAELAQRIQAEQDRLDAQRRAEARQAEAARATNATVESDAQLAWRLQEAERLNAAPAPAPAPARSRQAETTRASNSTVATDAQLARLLQEAERLKAGSSTAPAPAPAPAASRPVRQAILSTNYEDTQLTDAEIGTPPIPLVVVLIHRSLTRFSPRVVHAAAVLQEEEDVMVRMRTRRNWRF
jgi:hypothetical protein